jgi:hypothetical protein
MAPLSRAVHHIRHCGTWLADESTRVQQARRRPGIRGLRSAAARVAVITLSVMLIVALIATGKWFQFDFRGDLYAAGQAIVHGMNPYQPEPLQDQAAVVSGGRTATAIASPRWPPPVLLAAVPLSLLPFPVAAGLFLLISLTAIIAALRLFGVRDWRCTGLALLSWPTVWGLWLGNISALLLLGTALAWRWRSRLWPLAGVVASVIAAKLLLWPLAGWLLATRRFRALAATGAIACAGVFAAWAVIGFAGMAAYPHMLAMVSDIGERRSASLVAFLLAARLPVAAARVAAVACAAGLLGAAWRVARHPDGDRRALGLAVMAALTATPVVWPHYLVLLFAPIALLSPRLSALWFLPMLAGLVPLPPAHPHIWTSLPGLAIELVIIAQLGSPLLRRRETHSKHAAHPAPGALAQ